MRKYRWITDLSAGICEHNQLKIFPVMAVLSLVLAACGGEKTDTGVTITAPEFAEPGEIVTAHVQSDLSEIRFVFEQDTYVRATSQSSVTFVMPDVSSSDALNLEVFSSGKKVGARSIRVRRPMLPVFRDLPRPTPFEGGNISKWAGQPRNAEGIPLFAYAGQLVTYHVNLSKIAQGYYALIWSGKARQEDVDQFMVIANWLRDNCEYEKYGFCSWRAYFDIPDYRLPDGWTSAMAQGQGISALISAYALTSDPIYFKVAMDAIAAFSYPIRLKGVESDYEGLPWFEEYGSEEMPAHVLNGFLFSLAGLYDAVELAHSEAARQAFLIGVRSLEQRIDRYDLGFTSAYDDSPLHQIASTIGSVGDQYHELHIFQLAWLSQKTGSEIILDVARRFLLYDTGGIQSDSSLKEISRKILGITASQTIDPDQHGVALLYDSNWTWLRYWSSNSASVRLEIDLQNTMSNGDPIVMREIRLTALSEADIPETLQAFSCSGDSRVAVTDRLRVRDHLLREFPHEINGYTSHTVVMDVGLLSLPCDRLELEMAPNPVLGMVRLRELNIHMEQPSILRAILNRYE